MRHVSILKQALLTCLLAVMVMHVNAQEIPDSLYKVNDSLSGPGGPQNVNKSFDLPGLSFYVDYNYKNGRPGGLVGSRDAYFHGKITVTPHMRADTANHILNVALEVKGEILEKRDGGESFGMIYELAEQDVTAAQLHIVRIKVYLGDRDTTIQWKDCLGGDINIPQGITKLKGLEVVYEGHEVMVRKTLFFGDATVNSSSKSGGIPWKWILPPLLIILGILAWLKLKKK